MGASIKVEDATCKKQLIFNGHISSVEFPRDRDRIKWNQHSPNSSINSIRNNQH
jgi:hypothetical protein